MRYNHFSMLPEEAFKPRNGRYGMTLEGGGGDSPPPAPTQTSQISIPEYAQPYMERLLGRAEAATEAPRQVYGGERFAGATPQQAQARFEASQMQTPGQFGVGTGMVGAAGLRALGTQYQPSQFSAQQIQSPFLRQFQMGPAMGVSAQQIETPFMQTAQTGFSPELQAFQMGPAQQVSSQQVGTSGIQAAQTGFRPELERFQMTAPERFGAEQAQMYADPYMQQVVDIQKRKAIEDAQRAQLGANLGAVRQGTYGGARQLLGQTERERALGQQLGDIQAMGSQAAFQQAQQQFERDRAAQMSAQQENLRAAMGVQELGTQAGLQTALANLTNEQQARVQSEANSLQAQGMNQESALRAALSNQQARLTTEQQNLAARLGVQELGTRTGLEASLANLSAAQQANVQNQSSQLQAMGMNQEQALRAALANQQAGLTVGQQNLQSFLETQRLGAQTSLEAQRANQQAMLDAQRMAEQSRQFGSELGLRGTAQAIEAGRGLAQIGQTEQAAELERLKAQEAFGSLTQGDRQRMLDLQYQDFMAQQQFPFTQMSYMADILRGIPGRSVYDYQQQPSGLQSMVGPGLLGLGMYREFMR
jgi:hypothetical protein